MPIQPALLAVSDLGQWAVCVAAHRNQEEVLTWTNEYRKYQPFYVLTVPDFPLPESHAVFPDQVARYWTGEKWVRKQWIYGEVLEISRNFYYP